MTHLTLLTPEKSEQLRLELALDEVRDDVAESGLPYEEALAISYAARDSFEADPQGATWAHEYRDLREAGWPWRVAAYIAWSASPRADRQPPTQLELAQDVLGLRSDRTIRKWRAKNPAIDAAVGLLQAKALFEHRADILAALITAAKDPSYRTHPDRKLALEMLGDYKQEIGIGSVPPPITADDMSAARAKAAQFEKDLGEAA
jgi:hypothetical protein